MIVDYVFISIVFVDFVLLIFHGIGASNPGLYLITELCSQLRFGEFNFLCIYVVFEMSSCFFTHVGLNVILWLQLPQSWD